MNIGGLGGRGDITAGNADSRSTRAPFTFKFISVVVKPSEAAASQVLYAHGEPRARHQHLREFRKDAKPILTQLNSLTFFYWDGDALSSPGSAPHTVLSRERVPGMSAW